MNLHRVQVGPIPPWLDARRLLGSGTWSPKGTTWSATLPAADAADVAARLRGLGFGGEAIDITVDPPLGREQVRSARTLDARRRRDTTPGFLRAGVKLDDQARWSLTPEALALAMGEHLVSLGVNTVVDAGCGAGGNTIGFARAGCTVFAIERDRQRLRDAMHNCAVYGVTERVRFFHGDATEATRIEADMWFCDPPWGVDYDRRSTRTSDLPLLERLLGARAGLPMIAKVPPSFFAPSCALRGWFGTSEGDWRRVKFVTASWSATKHEDREEVHNPTTAL